MQSDERFERGMAPAVGQDRGELLVDVLIGFREKTGVLARGLDGIFAHGDAKFDFAAVLVLLHGIKRKLGQFIGRIGLRVVPLGHGESPREM